jgi:predicted homoserine dehydrogenase-like protein
MQQVFRAGLIGVGEFGATFAAQVQHIPALAAAVLCDRDVNKALTAYRSGGIAEDQIRVCDSRAAAVAALGAGQCVVVTDSTLVAQLPVDIVIEATGAPETGARNAKTAIEHGKHVAIVTKETDCAVGPILDELARRAGRVCTSVDGDQPSLLIGLIAQARALGFEIIAAGKSSEYDFIYDPRKGQISRLQQKRICQKLNALWELEDVAAGVAQRARSMPEMPRTTVPDLCEMAIVCNATGLLPDRPQLHAPIARTVELPDIFCPVADGGILQRRGSIDIFNCLRRPDELSFAGGVFVVVACPDENCGRLLKDKGLPVSRDNRYALLHNPVHLLGMEAPVSILAACVEGRSSSGDDVRPRVDLVARTTQAFKAGSRLDLAYRHSVDGLDALLLEAKPASGSNPIPYYMAAGNVLKFDVPANTILTCDMIEAPAVSTLWQLRAQQDLLFLQ